MDMVGSVVPAFGDIHVVVSTSDSADPNYQKLSEVFQPSNGFVRFWTSLSDAYNACTSNNNDVILLDAHSTHSLSAGIAWSKSRIHLIGMDGGERLVQQGAKVQLATAATTAYVILNTGVRNSFRNVKFIQAATAGTGLTVFQDGGEGTLFKNCSFVFGVANNLGSTSAREFLAGSDSATFLDCTFGSDTLLTSAARSVFHIDQVTASQEFKSNLLRRCNFLISSSDNGAQFVKMDAAGDVLFTNLFDDCTFQASIDSAGGIALTRAVSTANNLVKGTLNFAYPRCFNCADFGTNGTNNDNLQVVAPLAVNTDLVGVAPVA
jgi:hypothetical protein